MATSRRGVGLAALLDRVSRLVPGRRILPAVSVATALLVLWNFGLIFQFGLHLVSPIGPISFRDAAYNQVAVVPNRASRMLSFFVSLRLHPKLQGPYQPSDSPASKPIFDQEGVASIGDILTSLGLTNRSRTNPGNYVLWLDHSYRVRIHEMARDYEVDDIPTTPMAHWNCEICIKNNSTASEPTRTPEAVHQTCLRDH